MRLVTLALLALLCTSVYADCRQASGGRMQGLKSTVLWHARTACGGSTMLWLRSFGGDEGKAAALRFDDLLIIQELESPQTLSLLASADVECRNAADTDDALVIAVGDWNPRAGQGERQAASRAWRVNPASRLAEELLPKNVSCVVR